MKKLPDKLSKLIEVALKDLIACEHDPKYDINMYNWHVPGQDMCEVCLAGAVMAKSCGTDITHYIWQDGERCFEKPVILENENKFSALDSIRCGYILEAFNKLNLNYCPAIYHQFHELGLDNTPDYEDNPEDFKHAMVAISGFLAAEGF